MYTILQYYVCYIYYTTVLHYIITQEVYGYVCRGYEVTRDVSTVTDTLMDGWMHGVTDDTRSISTNRGYYMLLQSMCTRMHTVCRRYCVGILTTNREYCTLPIHKRVWMDAAMYT